MHEVTGLVRGRARIQAQVPLVSPEKTLLLLDGNTSLTLRNKLEAQAELKSSAVTVELVAVSTETKHSIFLFSLPFSAYK